MKSSDDDALSIKEDLHFASRWNKYFAFFSSNWCKYLNLTHCECDCI